MTPKAYSTRKPALSEILNMPWRLSFLLFLALSSLGVWVNLLGYSPTFLETMVNADHYSTGRYSYLLGRVLLLLSFILFWKFLEKRVVVTSIVSCTLLCVITCLLGFGSQQILIDSLTLDLTGQFLMGAGYVFLIYSFHLLIAQKLRIAHAVVVIAMSQAAEQIVANGLNALLAPGVITVLCIALPLISLAAFLQAKNLSKDTPQEKYTGRAARYYVVLMMGAFAGLAMLSASSAVGFWGNVRVDYFAEERGEFFLQTLLACVGLVALAYFTLYRRAHEPLAIRYILPYLALIISFFAVNTQRVFTLEAPVFDTAIMSMEYFAHVFAWVALVSGVQRIPASPYWAAGVSGLVYSGASFAWELLSFSSLFSYTFLAITCCLLVIITALNAPVVNGFYFQHQKTPSLRESSQVFLQGESHFAQPASDNAPAARESRIRLLGSYCGLTEREIDVLALMVKGRTRSRIQQELTISASTVKTHTSNIYAKMGVHSRQELLDLFFDEQVQGRALPGAAE